jgi:sulfide:quinone oxidoreductase
VKEYVPALMGYIERYRAKLHFQQTLTRIDGPARKAWFTEVDAEGKNSEVETEFDMIHVVPPQVAPDFVRVSPLADQAGWLDVDQATLRHKTFEGVYALGDVCNAPNAKMAESCFRPSQTGSSTAPGQAILRGCSRSGCFHRSTGWPC